MARQQVDIGVEGNDGTGDSIRESFKKVNENFQELYAVFGIGGQISFTDLSDTPDTYEGNENKVPTVRSDGSGINLLELASNNALDGSIDTIGFDFSVDGKLIVRQLVSRVSNDPEPTLGGPLNAATQPIAGVTVSQAAVDTFNSVYGTDYDLGDLVINKSFADRNYQEKEVAGGGLRLADEPADVTQYTITATGLSLGNFVATGHGLSDAFNGAEFIFRTTGTPPFGVTNEGLVFIRIIDTNTISFYESESDAINNTGRILLSGGTGTFTITDAAYDPSLPGNWLSNVAIPRKSAVRRQGDIMTGALNLFDHPGELAGTGLPNGPDDLQAATKLYVDNAAAASQVNLFVSTTGSDLQTFTPDGKEGRQPGYAFRTINAAARIAEELIESAPFEPGPYMQTMTFNTGAGVANIVTAGIASPIAGRNNARTLILANKEFVAKEVTGYLDATFPAFAGTYNAETDQQDIEYILDSVSLDALLGNNANYLSRWSGIRYYSNVSGRRAIGSQRVQTIAGIEYAKTLVTQFILTNTAPPTLYQNRVAQSIQPLVVPDASADDAIGAKFDIVLDVINDGVLNAPSIVDGQTTYKLNVSNSNFGFIDQANPENTDIIPGKVVRGKNSGAIGRIIDYKYEAGPRAVSVATTDEIEIQLLEPFEFELGEELEYGNIVRETQITIRVESGIYEEDYPIRVPANVSIKGDEFRRVIVRPKLRVSQSRYVNTFFYRDAEFDGLILGKSSIETVETVSSADVNRTAGVYTVDSFVSTGQGTGAEFEITVDSTGAVADVTVTIAGVNFVNGELITISDELLGEGGAADVTIRVTKIPNGVEYVNPLTGNVEGYFGYHYLLKPDRLRNTGAGYENVGKWETAALALIDNREFIQEQTVNFVEDQYPALIGSAGYSRTKCARDAGLIVDAMIKDLRNGGNEFSLEAQGEYYAGAVEVGTETETVAGIQHIATIAKRIIRGLAPVTIYGLSSDFSFDDFNGDGDPALWQSGVTFRLGNVVKFTFAGTERYYTPTKEHVSGSVFNATEINEFWREIDGPETVVQNLINTVAFAFDLTYNPPLRNDEMDAFLMNDATILRNLTVQGHGGFMLVLDPEGQVLTKSPYVQTGSSFSRSRNRQVFSGGLFVDAFVGNSAVQVSGKVDGSPFRLSIQSLPDQGLFIRRPQTPCAFYIDGRRFQVNAVTQYDPDFGTAELILDPSSNNGQGFTGVTSVLATGVDLDDFTTPIPLTLQTAGNRSMLGNDFTQINDLGYGLVAVNGALSEMVSMFTYYCHVSYYAKNGSEIRSLGGSSCYGEFGLIAEGSDPNEIPDSIQLVEDMTQPAKTFTADVILYLTGPVVLQAGDVVTQIGTTATGTVSANTSQIEEGGTGSSVVYLVSTQGAFDTTNQLSITGPITGDSTVTALGANSVPARVDGTGYGNARENLSLHVYDMKNPPSNRSEFDIFQPLRPAFARYEVANVEVINHIVGGYENVGTDIPYTFVAGPDATGTHAGAIFRIKKTITDGYTVDILNPGAAYGWNDSFVVSGGLLGGVDVINDCTIVVDEIDDDDSTDGAGIITQVSASGVIYIEDTTPVFNGIVYKLNFSTSDAQFSDGGLLEAVPYGVLIQYRRNQTHIIADLARPDILTIRPSTALIFDENPGFVYRSISFLTSNSIGTELPNDTLQAGFDSSYDYIRLIVDSAKAQETDLSDAGTTKGGTAGDVRIAVLPFADDNEIFRLNNNTNTPAARRPIGSTADSLKTPPIITWQGKKHFVFNYRGVQTVDGVETEVAAAEDNEYAIVDLLDVGEEINYPATSTGIASPMILGSETVTLRAGLQAGATGDVTINISTCRATGHDFLNIGTGGFNASNYPSVIFGEPAEKNDANEVDERGKGRVFFVSTDQNGIFRVGRFFSVDQGTGTVTFSASIALSDVDGLGFKRGVVVTEFSTDTAMTDNASDTVPTELAVRGFVNRRLGYDVNGNPVANKLGPGVLAPNGAVPMTGDLNAAGNTITNLKAPATDSDAATKAYVDNANAGLDELQDLRSLEYNNYAEGQLLVATGFKKLIISAGSIVGGSFVRGQTITGSVTGATGSIVDVKTDVGFEGNIVEITYTAITGEFSDGKPAGTSPDPDVVFVAGGPQGLIVDGPIDEWANGIANPASDLTITTNKEVTVVGSTVTDRFTTLNFQIKANSIVNSDVNANANISQSKLNLNAATTRVNATAISQADLGVAAFDPQIFAITDGWVTIENGQLPLRKIQRIQDGNVLGNWSGDSSDDDIDQIAFSTVIQEGGGLADVDFVSIIGAGSDPGEALIKTGEGTYGISNVTTSGEVNSIVKTRANGSIQANSLILGGDSNFEILSLDTTTVVFKTPAQGEILRAVGGSGGANPTFPTVEIPGDVNIANTGVSESVLQNQSTLNGESRLAVDWVFSSFIEAPGERGSASTGVAIGAGTGVTTAGQIAMITADSATSSSVAPFVFSPSGAAPDTDNAYDIGTASLKYANIYATLFRGTATESYYADLAENYLADAVYEPGTVLVFGGATEVTVSTEKDTRRVAGVVTTNPAHLMNSHLKGDHVVGIALQGRVPCKVIGRVAKGDLLVASAVPGYAMVNNNAGVGTVIGKALENKFDTERGVIEVVVGKH